MASDEIEMVEKTCSICKATETSQWRRADVEKKTCSICNKCYQKRRREEKKEKKNRTSKKRNIATKKSSGEGSNPNIASSSGRMDDEAENIETLQTKLAAAEEEIRKLRNDNTILQTSLDAIEEERKKLDGTKKVTGTYRKLISKFRSCFTIAQ